MRLVLDTNTVVSGLIWGGVPGQLIDAAAASLARASEIVIWTVVMVGYSEGSLDYTQETCWIGYITPAARPCGDNPTATMWEFLNADRWIIKAQRRQCFPRADSWGRRVGRSAAAWPDCVSAWGPAHTMSVNAGKRAADPPNA